MTEENTNNTGTVVTDEAGVQPDAAGKTPETVTWGQYVATKETIGGKLSAERAKSTDLQTKLDAAVTPEDHAKVKADLETANKSIEATLNASLTTKRAAVVKSGVTEERAGQMTDAELNTAIEVLALKTATPEKKPGPDLGGGGGGAIPSGTPQQLATQAYSSSNR